MGIFVEKPPIILDELGPLPVQAAFPAAKDLLPALLLLVLPPDSPYLRECSGGHQGSCPLLLWVAGREDQGEILV